MSDKPAAPGGAPALPKETGTSSSVFNQSLPEKPSTTASSSSPETSLQSLNPDFVIDVKVSTDAKDAAQNKKNIDKLVSLLTSSGFYLQIRQGNPGSVFIFVKSTFDQLRSLHISSEIKDYTFGVQKLIPKGEDLTIESLDSVVTPAEKLRLVYDFLTSPSYDSGLGITPTVGEWAFVSSIFPPHDPELNMAWIKRWAMRGLIDDNELDWARNQFGEKCAFYFAYLHFYTLWLVAPAVLGFIIHFFVGCYSVFFGIFNIVWGVVFINAWKRKENVLALRWGVKGSPQLETPRHAFKPLSFEVDPVTGIKKPSYPYWKRAAKQLASVPLILGAVLVIFLLQSFALTVEIFITQVYHGPLKSVLKLIPTIVLAAVVPTVVAIYRIIVFKIIAWENHATDDSFNYSFNQKLFSVSFITSTGSMFLTAFVYLPFGHSIIPHLEFVSSSVNTFVGRDIAGSTEYQVNGNRLEDQVLYMMVTAQVISTFMETVVPYIQIRALEKVDQFISKGVPTFEDSPSEAQYLTNTRLHAKLPEFSVDAEYQEMVIQFAFVNIFGVAWSLAPVAAILNDWLELRGDAGKIAFFTRRPVPERADSIGFWHSDLRYVSWIGSVVTTSLVIMYGPTYHNFANLTKGGFGLVSIDVRVLLAAIIIAEHFYFFLGRAVALVFSKFPTPDEIADEKEKYLIRKDFVALQLNAIPEAASIGKRSLTKPSAEELKWKALSSTEAQAASAIKATVDSYIAKTTDSKKNA